MGEREAQRARTDDSEGGREKHSARGRETSEGAMRNQSAFSKAPITPEQLRLRKAMGGLVWKVILACVFLGLGVNWVLQNSGDVSEFMFWLGVGFCVVGGIFGIWFVVEAARALPLLCTTRAETAQATHMQTYYPPQQQHQGGMAVGTPAMASNQAASSGGVGGSGGQPEYTRYQVTPGAYQGKPSGPQQPSAPAKG